MNIHGIKKIRRNYFFYKYLIGLILCLGLLYMSSKYLFRRSNENDEIALLSSIKGNTWELINQKDRLLEFELLEERFVSFTYSEEDGGITFPIAKFKINGDQLKIYRGEQVFFIFRKIVVNGNANEFSTIGQGNKSLVFKIKKNIPKSEAGEIELDFSDVDPRLWVEIKDIVEADFINRELHEIFKDYSEFFYVNPTIPYSEIFFMGTNTRLQKKEIQEKIQLFRKDNFMQFELEKNVPFKPMRLLFNGVLHSTL